MPKVVAPPDIKDVLNMLVRVEKRDEAPTNERLEEVWKAARHLSAQADESFIWLGELARRMIIAFKKQKGRDPSYRRLMSTGQLLKHTAAAANQNYNTFRQYYSVVRFYGGAEGILKLQRNYPDLTYSHLRLAKTRRSLSEAVEFLKICDMQKMSPDDAIALDKMMKAGRLIKDTRQFKCYAKIARVVNNQVTFTVQGAKMTERVLAAFRELMETDELVIVQTKRSSLSNDEFDDEESDITPYNGGIEMTDENEGDD